MGDYKVNAKSVRYATMPIEDLRHIAFMHRLRHESAGECFSRISALILGTRKSFERVGESFERVGKNLNDFGQEFESLRLGLAHTGIVDDERRTDGEQP